MNKFDNLPVEIQEKMLDNQVSSGSIINIKTKVNSKLFKFKLWYLKMRRLWGYL